MATAALAVALLIGPATPALSDYPYVPTVSMHAPDLFAGRDDPAMTGEKSPYKGKFYRASQRTYALCVLRRESNAHWFSTNRANGYFGGRQFSAALAVGATYMMTAELREVYGKRIGEQIARKLRATEMHKWLPRWQDQAFFTVVNWRGDGSGAQHFAGGRSSCAL